MQILPANLFDLNSLRKLQQLCFPEDAWPLIDLIAVLSVPNVIRLKASEDGQMTGFIAGDQRDGLAWVANICVSPSHRNHGVGRALMEACESRFSLPRVRLCVKTGNAGAIHLYEKLGYRPVETWQQYYNDRSDALVMEKERVQTTL